MRRTITSVFFSFLLWISSAAQTIPGKPVIYSPANNETNLSLTPSFKWGRASDAEYYNVEITGNGYRFVDSLIADTVYRLPSFRSLRTGQQYTLRIIAKSSLSMSTYSDPISFSTRFDSPPGRPEPLQPGYKVNIGFNEPQGQTNLVWSPGTSASAYHVQLSTSYDFTQIVTDDSTVTNTFRTVTVYPGRDYFWRVRSKNPEGKSLFTEVRTFKVSNTDISNVYVNLISPANFAANTEPEPVFSWKNVSGSEGYQFMLFDSTLNLKVTEMLLPASDTVYTLDTILQPGHRYSWKVLAIRDSVLSQGYNYIFTTTTAVPPAKPAYYGKNAGEHYVTLLVYAGNTSLTYSYEWSANRNFSSLLRKDSNAVQGTLLAGAYMNPALRHNTWYYVRVRTYNSYGASPYLTDSIYYQIPEPGSFSIKTPANQQSNVVLTPVLEWSQSRWATQYKLKIESTGADSSVVFSREDVTDTSFTVPAGILKSGKRYYLWITAVNARAEKTSFVIFNTTTGETAPAPALQTPEDTVFESGTSPVLTWQRVPATSYCIQVSYDSLFSHIVEDTCGLDINRFTFALSSQRRQEALLIKYFWRVAARNSAGQGPWSQASTFFADQVLTSLLPAAGKDNRLFYPNPAEGTIHLSTSYNSTWLMRNMEGQTVLAGTGNEIEVTSLQSGMYLLEIQEPGKEKKLAKVIRK